MNGTMRVWQGLLAMVVCSILVGVIILGFTRAGNKVDRNDETIKTLAPYPYVDKQIADVKKEINMTESRMVKAVDDMREETNTKLDLIIKLNKK